MTPWNEQRNGKKFSKKTLDRKKNTRKPINLTLQTEYCVRINELENVFFFSRRTKYELTKLQHCFSFSLCILDYAFENLRKDEKKLERRRTTEAMIEFFLWKCSANVRERVWAYWRRIRITDYIYEEGKLFVGFAVRIWLIKLRHCKQRMYAASYIYILLKLNGQIINHLLDVFYIIINLGCFRLGTVILIFFF